MYCYYVDNIFVINRSFTVSTQQALLSTGLFNIFCLIIR